MNKAHQMIDLAAEFERRAKTPTNGATTKEFLLAAAALRLAAQADAPLPLPTDKYAVDDPWCRPADVPQSPRQYRWRHKKRGTTYVEIGRGNLQIATDPVEEDDRVVIYQSEADGRLWVRGEAEFGDGRFEALPDTRIDHERQS
jgi:hypothetical protein